MQLTLRDVSTFLGVPEATVTKWIKGRGLPAEYVGGQYRCHRAELLEWATANRIKVSAQLFDHIESQQEATPSLSQALDDGGIHYHVRGAGKEDALRALVQLLPLPEDVDRELIFGLLRAREASATTAVGDGVALPHVRNPIVLHVSRPMVTLCFLDTPVDFGALDGKPVHVLFSLICPTMRSHLQLLSRLSFALHDAVVREVLLEHGQRGDILRELRRVELSVEKRD